MSATVADFRLIFPEFSQTSDRAVQVKIDEALEIHNVSERASLFCTAHLLALEAARIAGTPILHGERAEERAGPLRATYRTMTEDGQRSAFFTSTPYGREFLILESRTPRVGLGLLTA